MQNRVTVVLHGEDRLSGVVNKAILGINNAGQSLTRNVTVPILGIGGAIGAIAGNFEAEMNRVAGLTGATGSEFEQLNELAKELGATTRFSATEAAASMAFLGATGYETNEILSALPKTLTLAAATKTDLAKTGNILTNILSGYRLEAEDAAWATDVLAKAFSARNLGTDLTSLGTSLEYVGPVAAASNLEFEETVAILGALGQGGIQASAAGTALRGMIASLESPMGRGAKAIERLGIVTHDASGQLRPITQIIDDLAVSGATSADMIELFGRRGAAAANILLAEGGSALRDFQEELEQIGGTGFADQLADRMSQGFVGSMTSLKSALEGLAIAIADAGLLEFLTSLATKATEFVRQLTAINPEILKTITVIAGVAAAVGPTLMIIGSIANGIGVVVSAIGILKPILVAVGAAISTFGTPVLIALTGIAAAGYAIYSNWDRLGPTFSQAAATFMAALTPLQEPLQVLFEQFKKLGGQVWRAAKMLGGAFAKVLKMATEEGSVLNSTIMNTAGFIGNLVNVGLRALIFGMNWSIRIVRGFGAAFLWVFKQIGRVIDAIGHFINRLRGVKEEAIGFRSITGGTAAVMGAERIGGAATGLLPDTRIGGLLGAAIAESRNAPSNSNLVMANDSEAILPIDQQNSLARALQDRSLSLLGAMQSTQAVTPSQATPQSKQNIINLGGITINTMSSNAREIVDEVIAELEERFRQYEAGFLT